jgi:hypothetical protein
VRRGFTVEGEISLSGSSSHPVQSLGKTYFTLETKYRSPHQICRYTRYIDAPDILIHQIDASSRDLELELVTAYGKVQTDNRSRMKLEIFRSTTLKQ